MDDSSSANVLTPIACRLISYDQWLVTHVDAGWTIKDVKLWILGKCLPSLAATSSRPATPMMPSRTAKPRPSSPITFAPDPHHRPMSPITFAQPVDASKKSDLSDDEDWNVPNREPESEGGSSFPSGGRISGGAVNGTVTRGGGHGQHNSRSDGSRSHHRPSASFSTSANHTDAQDPTAEYNLIRFSTGQILEEDLTLLMYDIRPYEMLEVHKATVIVNLPRQFLREYIQPYWEGDITALRVVYREDTLPHPDRDRRDKHQKGGRAKDRQRLEWRSRWIVIRNGELLVFKDRNTPEPSQTLAFKNLTSIHGADHIKNIIALAPEQRIICAKFKTPPKPSRTASSGGAASAPSTSQYGTTTVISAGPSSKSTGKRKLQIRSSFPSSSSLRSQNGKPSSSKGLTESSSKSNLNAMFTISSWKSDKKKQKKDKGRAKEKAQEKGDTDVREGEPTTSKDATKDKGKGRAHPQEEPPPPDPGHEENDKNSILSSPVFARTSGSDDDSDASDNSKGGTWRSKGGYGYKYGYSYRYVGGGRTGDGEAEHEGVSGDGTGPESGAGDDDHDTPNETTTYTLFDSVGPRTAESSYTTATLGDTASRQSDIHSVEPSLKRAHEKSSVHFSSRAASALGGRSGEWIVMDVRNDHAFSSLLRIFHRMFPDPIDSAFVSGLSSTAPLSTTSSPTAPTPPTLRTSSSQDSLIGSTRLSYHTSKSRRSRRRESVFSTSLSVQANTFGALPYPEWRIDIAVKAQKAGMGDVGRAMGWMLWGRRLTGEDDSLKEEHSVHSSMKSKGSKGRRKSKQPDQNSLASRGSGSGKPNGASSSKKSVRSNNSTLTPTPSTREDPYASDVSGGVSSDEFGLDPSDESDGYSSEAEWQSWMADLHRQARVRHQHQIELDRRPVQNEAPNFPWISGGWNQSPYLHPGGTSPDIPQSQMQALRLYQEGRKALEPTAVVISTGPPIITPPHPPVPIQSRPPPTSTIPPLSSPSSSESLANPQRPRGMSFSPVDQPSSATPISAYSQNQYPLEPDKLELAQPPHLVASAYSNGSTPTPRSLNFPAPLAYASTGASSPPREPSSAFPSSMPSLDHRYAPTQRRASSASIGSPSPPRNGDAYGVSANAASIGQTGSSVKNDTLSLTPALRSPGHRPRLSVTTTGNAASSHGSPPPTHLTSPHRAQSPTKSTAKRILHRMRSGSSMRGAGDRHVHDDS
ncbi:hypothetical protein ONZ45_g402 [Pleurotus djamor]|nr:hypothetical protein ONZ45_g402 [Pleurotus djamor]